MSKIENCGCSTCTTTKNDIRLKKAKEPRKTISPSMKEIEDMLIEISGIDQKEAEKFWEERRKKHYKHICDYSLDELRERHKLELKKIYNRRKAVEIGILLMGDYYLDGFSSRSCSGWMSQLIGNDTEYLDFYGSSSSYFYLRR